MVRQVSTNEAERISSWTMRMKDDIKLNDADFQLTRLKMEEIRHAATRLVIDGLVKVFSICIIMEIEKV